MCSVLIVFFFKQKTAYEMRISDWSSDVCSSDLVWTVLLAILTFSFSLIGTFIVRSGVLTSVHAFATDPERGVFILALLSVAIGGSLILFAVRAPLLKPGGLFAPVSREGGLEIGRAHV